MDGYHDLVCTRPNFNESWNLVQQFRRACAERVCQECSAAPPAADANASTSIMLFFEALTEVPVTEVLK